MPDLSEPVLEELKHLFTARALSGETMVLNMGPQHPSTHGVLRLIVELDGETVIRAIPDIGFLHTGIEKNMESKTYIKALVMTDRLDYLNNIGNNLVYCLAIEKLMETKSSRTGECAARVDGGIATHRLAFSLARHALH